MREVLSDQAPDEPPVQNTTKEELPTSMSDSSATSIGVIIWHEVETYQRSLNADEEAQPLPKEVRVEVAAF